ncbi:hypothetical protein [Burkholderia ubonensis]|uniref:hypothetical protein n=1 Tax=Burkholderia ubonensis TaxID=101571 RepID=UPI00075B08EE|nr:hypothetical protein [Burkholderia ubonensis]KWB79382.1 hypothetical protein WL42_12520 [Burkholderia ubonensis]
MMVKKQAAALAVGIALILAGSVVGAYSLRKTSLFEGGAAKGKEHAHMHFMSLDKVLVSVPTSRGSDGTPVEPYRVCSVDLAIKTDPDEPWLKDRMLLLRSDAVRALATHSYDEIRQTPIDQLESDVGKKMLKAMTLQGVDHPFDSVIVTQLICE